MAAHFTVLRHKKCPQDGITREQYDVGRPTCVLNECVVTIYVIALVKLLFWPCCMCVCYMLFNKHNTLGYVRGEKLTS